MMMKYFSFLVICCLLFNLPTVEGQQTLLGLLLNILFFTPKRNERDCKALILSSGVNNTETCSCRNNLGPQIVLECAIFEKKCLSPSDATYCTDTRVYSAYSKEDRKLLAVNMSPNVQEEKIVTDDYYYSSCYSSRFEFAFARDDADAGSPSSNNKYTNCSAYSVTYDAVIDADSLTYHCTSCDICDSGVDFKYNCSNVPADGKFAFGNETLLYTNYPGPIVDSCYPIADFIRP